MASAWGASWGVAFGNAWGRLTPVVDTPYPGGAGRRYPMRAPAPAKPARRSRTRPRSQNQTIIISTPPLF